MKNFVIAIIVIGIIGGGVWFVKNREVAAPVVENTTPTKSATNETTNLNATVGDTSTSTSVSTTKTFAMSEVATHADKNSCYTTINSKVYDLTSWVSKHPGGSGAILSICGKDGTSSFMDQHGNQKRPNEKLDSFYLGDLAK